MKEAQNIYQPIIDYFERVAALNETEKDLVKELFTYHSFKRKEFLLREGEICNKFCFIVKGCMRMYMIDEKGTTHILQFAAENWIIVDALSFRQRTASNLSIDTLEASEVLYITPENLKLLYEKAPKFNYIIRDLLEKHLTTIQRRLLQYMSSTGEERYLAFLKTYAQFANRLPQTQIAAYLGITPEHLSKIRKEITKPRHFIS
ncbi:Crp/Fnr family transcriptional regulator [uncultured Chryseobacterium sp.]|uniref:Crp/Fnr family transcriptional regulator n=1 Tax=uncultured Chryseobacterium sp. TaxID=259322 RepID=UPI00258AFFCB|nr:Crp/Fnr family transcriptional regulator [uncultured Chryseobacterium sp.]